MSSFFRTADTWFDRRAVCIPERQISTELRWQHLRNFGDFPLAYAATIEQYISTFGDERGAVAYAQKMGVTFALGDPLVGAVNARTLISEFVDAFGDPVFVACQHRTAELLASRGYSINRFGHDTAIDLPGHSFAGGAYKRIRYASNLLKSKGITVTEQPGDAFSGQEIKKMSARWRETRVASREVRFLNRAFSVKPGPEVRRFYAISDQGVVLGFISFDPIYTDQKIVAYLASQKRRVPEDSAYLDLAIMRHAIDIFKEEGIETVYMGLSPMADIDQSGFDMELHWLRKALRNSYESDWINRRFFNSKGLAEYKNRFRGRLVPLYIGLPPKGSNLFKVFALLRLIQVL